MLAFPGICGIFLLAGGAVGGLGAGIPVQLDELLQRGILVHALEGGHGHYRLGARRGRGIPLDVIVAASHDGGLLDGRLHRRLREVEGGGGQQRRGRDAQQAGEDDAARASAEGERGSWALFWADPLTSTTRNPSPALPGCAIIFCSRVGRRPISGGAGRSVRQSRGIFWC